MLRGEGEFFGAGAYTQFRRLMEVFRSPGAGALRHPVWQCSRAYFTRLELAQEPREDYVAYSFAMRARSRQRRRRRRVRGLRTARRQTGRGR